MEQRTHSTGSVQACTKCKNNFTLDEDDFSFYEKMNVPPPTVCPDCRFKMRGLYRNEMTLYTGRKCSLCEKSIISMFNPKSPYTVYCNDCYRSDAWNASDYAMPYDKSRPFFEQLQELLTSVPKISTSDFPAMGEQSNSDFTNTVGGLKDCYMIFNSGPAETSYYSRGINGTVEVMDAYFGSKDEQCYETVNVHESSKIIYGTNIKGSVDCYMCEDLSGCTDCFGSVGLRNKSHFLYNQEVTKQEYDQFIEEWKGSRKRFDEEKEKFMRHRLAYPKRENNSIKSIDSVGDYLFEAKNIKYSFEIRTGEDSKYNFSNKDIKDSYGTTGYGIDSERLLECVACGHSTHVIGSWGVDQSMNVAYSFSCISNNHDLIGCDSLKNSSYCILNTQYTKEEYESLSEHIVRELTNLGVYGLMMPPELAPYAYNECIAGDNMPLTKEEAIAQGYRWEDDIQITKGKETLQSQDIPDHINDVPESITKEILRCVGCERNYRITERELLFYRKMILPVPHHCFYCRHKDRIRRRGPYQFWERECARCHKHITTTYAPDRQEIVYCETCYQREVI